MIHIPPALRAIVRPVENVVRSLWARPEVRSRWPLAVVVVVPLAFLLIPLAFDLFFTIPWYIRKVMGQLTFFGILGLGLRRLLTVKPTDRWPADDSSVGLQDSGLVARALPWALQLAVASLAWPLIRYPENLGFGDWDHHLQKFEAIRQTILVWHQFPWWTPWVRAGFPLASEPESGLVSPATLLVLLFGTGVGVRLAAVACLMIAVEGARRLAWHWFREPWSAAAAGLIYGINGAVLVYTVAGYFIPMSYCAAPWMMYHAFRIGHRLRDGLALGAWSAFDILNGIQYPSVYAFVLAGLVWIRALRVQPRALRTRLLAHTLAALGVVLALTGWRLATSGSVLWDYPRVWSSFMDDPPSNAFRWLFLRPGPAILETATSTYFWESTRYVGPVVVILAFAGLIQGWRWWHTLTLLGFWLALGSVNWHHPSYWLTMWPVFKTMHVVSRWRIFGMLGLGLSVASVVARLRTDRRALLRGLAVILVLVIAVDLVSYGHEILPVATRDKPTDDVFPGPKVERVVNVQNNLGFPAILRGYGVVRAHEPLLGYDRNLPTARIWRGHPLYLGEAWANGRALEPESWSPNRIVYRAQPNEEVHINQNPGSWWLVNGRQPFADWRCVEWTKDFTVRADNRGRLELQIAPKGLALGLGIHVAGLVLLAAAVAWCLRRGIPRPPVDGGSFTETSASIPNLSPQ